MDINKLTDQEYANLERKVRRAANHEGEVIHKGRDAYGGTGYMITDFYTNGIICGEGFDLSFDTLAKMYGVAV